MDASISIGQAIILSLLFASRIFIVYSFDTVDTMFVGIMVGLVLGDMTTAIKTAAVIQLLYIGLVAPGANYPADPQWAMLVGCICTVKTGMDPAQAAVIAIPCGLLGTQIMNFRRFVNSTWIHIADKHAAKGNAAGVFRAGTLYTWAFGCALYFSIALLICLVGPTTIQKLMEILPEWLWNGLSMAGGMLPAVGFAMVLNVISQKKLMPFFLAGFSIVAYWGVPLMPMALLGAFLAYLYITFERRADREEA